MAQSGASVSPDCITKFNDLKLNHNLKYIIYKLSDDYKEIVVEDTSTTADWDEFRSKLVNSKSKNKSGKEGIGARYAVYDLEFDAPDGEGKRSKIVFISWTPDECAVYPKMTYAASKDAIRRALNGVAAEIQANDEDEIEHGTVIDKVRKGTR